MQVVKRPRPIAIIRRLLPFLNRPAVPIYDRVFSIDIKAPTNHSNRQFAELIHLFGLNLNRSDAANIYFNKVVYGTGFLERPMSLNKSPSLIIIIIMTVINWRWFWVILSDLEKKIKTCVSFVLACFQASAAPRPENSESDEKDTLL
jgi:hypothetical protein